VNDYHAQLDKLYQQLLEVLEEMAALASDVAEDDEEDISPLGERESIDALVEVAEEHGLDPDSTGRVLKAVAAFVKEAKDV